ncbi:MAG TPA: hypothetical protein VIF59_12255 [Methylomirabilota bacterium]|jgi:hypothetical protein
MRWREALGIGLLLAGADAAGAQETFTVKALRTEKVTLYDCNPEKDKRKPQREVARKDFQGGWPATRDPASSLYLKVQVDRTEYCVRAFSVETDRTVTIEKDQECGAMVAGKQPKTGATRGVGEKCSR